MYIIAHKKIFLAIGIVIMLVSAGIVGMFGLNLGIDFTGGALTEVAYDEQLPMGTLEEELDTFDLGAYSLRETAEEGGRAGYIIRTRDLSEEERIEIGTALTSFGAGGEVLRYTSIGPVIGEELKDKSVWAIGSVVLIIILYVAFAFRGVSYPVGSFTYGGITILALVHDILVPTALMSILGVVAGIEVDVLFVMALLAILGYSVNDTIVVFDRVRENILAHRSETRTTREVAGVEEVDVQYTLDIPFDEIIGKAVSETMLRSINTSATTLLAVGALYLLGGEVTETFALIMMAGVIAGTYSSIFFANPVLSYIGARALAKPSKPTSV